MTLGSEGATWTAPTDEASVTESKMGNQVMPALVVFQTALVAGLAEEMAARRTVRGRAASVVVKGLGAVIWLGHVMNLV